MSVLRWLHARLARPWIAIAAWFLVVAGFAGFSWLDAGRPAGSPGVVALQLAFSSVAFARIVAAWGAAGVQAYVRSTLLVDFAFPLAYALALSSSSACLSRKAGREAGRFLLVVVALPWLAAMLDYLENALHLVLLADAGPPAATWVLVASLAAAIKWGLIAFSAGVALRLWIGRSHRP